MLRGLASSFTTLRPCSSSVSIMKSKLLPQARSWLPLGGRRRMDTSSAPSATAAATAAGTRLCSWRDAARPARRARNAACDARAAALEAAMCAQEQVRESSTQNKTIPGLTNYCQPLFGFFWKTMPCCGWLSPPPLVPLAACSLPLRTPPPPLALRADTRLVARRCALAGAALSAAGAPTAPTLVASPFPATLPSTLRTHGPRPCPAAAAPLLSVEHAPLCARGQRLGGAPLPCAALCLGASRSSSPSSP